MVNDLLTIFRRVQGSIVPQSAPETAERNNILKLEVEERRARRRIEHAHRKCETGRNPPWQRRAPSCERKDAPVRREILLGLTHYFLRVRHQAAEGFGVSE